MGVALETAVVAHKFVEFAFADVTVARMPQIVTEAYGFDEVAVNEEVVIERAFAITQEPFADRATDAGDLDGMGQSSAVVIINARLENLSFRLEAAEGEGEDKTVAVEGKWVSVVELDFWTRAFEVGGVEIVVK